MPVADVRLARADDAAEIARIQRSTWEIAFSELVDVSVLDPGDAERQWLTAVEHDGTDVFVATEGRYTVGFCVCGPAPSEELAGPDGELPADAEHTGLIATVLVEPRWGRRGHGGRLLAAAARALRSRGAMRAVTWVAESDSATLSFYRRADWQPDGTLRTLDAGTRQIRELRLVGGLDVAA